MKRCKFDFILDYARFKRHYDALFSIDSPWKENFKGDIDIENAYQEEDPREISKLNRAIDIQLDKFINSTRSTERILLMPAEVKSINIGISMIEEYYKENPDISMYQVVKNMMKYRFIKQKYGAVTVYRFIYTFFYNFPRGYYLTMTGYKTPLNAMAIFPLERIEG